MLGVFLDIETNGLDPFSHIPLEIAFVIVDLKRGVTKAEYSTIIASDEALWNTYDANSLRINGFHKEELRQGKSKEGIQQEITSLFARFDIRRGRAFFICQNPSFDRPFFGKIVSPYAQEQLLWPYHWLDLASMYWARHLVQKQTTSEWNLITSKDAIAAYLGLPPEERPHRAMNGVRHLIDCYTRLVGFPDATHSDRVE